MSFKMVALTAALLLLTGCATPSTEPAESVKPESTVPASPAAEPESDGLPTTSTCPDPIGDAEAMDLTDVALSLDGEYLTAVFTLTTPIPGSDTAMVGLSVSTKAKDDANYLSRQLGVKTLDGSVIGFFVADLSTGQQTNLDQTDLTVAENVITAKFPASAVRELGAGWEFYAFATAAGVDTDACPGAVMSFEQMTFG